MDRANTVPLAALPPPDVVPYKVLPDRIKPPIGLAPSPPPVKLCRTVKFVPLVVTPNTVPLPLVPPPDAVPYKMLPDRIKPACGNTPSLPPVKLCRTVKPVPLVPTANIVPPPLLPPPDVVPYRVLPDRIKLEYGLAPSLLVVPVAASSAVNVCTTVKFVRFVLTANTVPLPFVPPRAVVPYRVLPDRIKPP